MTDSVTSQPATWRILELPDPPPQWTGSIMYSCPGCGKEALLPIVGLAIAQIGAGLVFEPGSKLIPKTIQCRFCRRRYEQEDGDVR